MRKLLLLPALMVGLVALPVANAEAVEYGFDCITDNAAASCTILEAQITVNVTDGAGDTVDFLFENSGPLASSIADVYFNDASGTANNIGDYFNWATMALSDSGAGVSFTTSCTPGDPPGANGFTDPVGACADSSAPVATNGVNPGEFLNINVTLLAGQTFAELIDAIDAGLFSIALHVQAFANGQSESGILIPEEPDGGGGDPVVAEPATLLLLGSGLVAAGARLRRRRNA